MGVQGTRFWSLIGRTWRGLLAVFEPPRKSDAPAAPAGSQAPALVPQPSGHQNAPDPLPMQPAPPWAPAPEARPEVMPDAALAPEPAVAIESVFESEPVAAVAAPVMIASLATPPATQPEAEVPEEEIAVAKKPANERAVVVRPDPEVEAFQRKAADLKGRIADLSARHAEMEQLVQDFRHAQYLALGETLAECLRLRVEYLRLKARHSGLAEDREAARAAEAEYAAYHEVRAEPEPSLRALGEEEQEELRALYRVAAMRCHPDRVADEDKATANVVFLQLQEAYRQGDRAALHRILRQLADDNGEQGTPVGGKAEYRKIISDLGDEAGDLMLAIQTLQLNETYRNAAELEDWDELFAPTRQRFEEECEALRQGIQAFSAIA